MIKNDRVLQEEFIPDEIEHRHDEVNRISSALEPIIDDDKPDNVILFGPTGTGKTCIAKFTVAQLREQIPELNHQYVNCWQDYNRFRVIYRVLEGLGKTDDIRRRSTPKDELIERIRKHAKFPYVVILDEVDQLGETKALYDLYTLPNITMILIANKETELFYHLDDRVESRLKGSVRVKFDSYTVEELVSILEARVRWGLRPGVIERDELELIADMAAGDARVAIGVLRAAARQAEREGKDHITTKVIKQALPDAREKIDQRTLAKLNEHQQILYDIITDEDSIKPEALYSRYRDQAGNPRSDRTLRKYLNKMEQYNLIESEGSTRARIYRSI